MRRRTAERALLATGLATVIAATGAVSTSSSVEVAKPGVTATSEFPTSPMPSYLWPAARAVIRAYNASQQPGSDMHVSRQDDIFAAPTRDVTFKSANGNTVDVFFTSSVQDPTSPSQIDGFGASVDGPGYAPGKPNSSSVVFYDLGDEWGGFGGYLTDPSVKWGAVVKYGALRTFGADRACYGLRVKHVDGGELKAHCKRQDLGAAALADNIALADQVIGMSSDRPDQIAVIPTQPSPASDLFPSSFEPGVFNVADLVPAP